MKYFIAEEGEDSEFMVRLCTLHPEVAFPGPAVSSSSSQWAVIHRKEILIILLNVNCCQRLGLKIPGILSFAELLLLLLDSHWEEALVKGLIYLDHCCCCRLVCVILDEIRARVETERAEDYRKLHNGDATLSPQTQTQLSGRIS